jgi:hypothetical protein
LASSAIDFRGLLKLNSTTVDRPKSAPTCWLLGTIGSMSHEVTKGQQTNLFTFELLDIEAHPETEPGLLDKINLKSLRSPYRKTLAADYWITPDAIHHLSDMLDRTVGDPDRSIEERLPETKGLRVMFKVNPQVDAEGKDTGQNSVDGRTLTLAAAA